MEVLADVNRDDGITCVVSLHQVEYARRYCPRTIALARRHASSSTGLPPTLTDQSLRELYGAAIRKN